MYVFSQKTIRIYRKIYVVSLWDYGWFYFFLYTSFVFCKFSTSNRQLCLQWEKNAISVGILKECNEKHHQVIVSSESAKHLPFIIAACLPPWGTGINKPHSPNSDILSYPNSFLTQSGGLQNSYALFLILYPARSPCELTLQYTNFANLETSHHCHEFAVYSFISFLWK